MRILLIHERYRYRGGEDAAVEAEAALLAGAGIEVATLYEDNRRIVGAGSAGLALRAIWSPEGRRLAAAAIDRARPDIVHVHNTFPLLSPSVYAAARSRATPVIQTLHNYRLLCPNGLMLRDGRPCELCAGRSIKWPAVVHACYRDSRAASAAVAAVVGVHQVIGTWRNAVDRFLALTPFAARKFIAGGLPPERIEICPPAVPDPGPAAAAIDDRSGALFVGRLSPEKGIEYLISAWRGLPHSLDVIGDGPLEEDLRRRAVPNIRFLGRLPASAVSAAMSRAALLVFPSLCHENFPMVVAEAAAHGLPSLAAAGGAVQDMIGDGVTGVLAPPGEAGVWRQQALELLANPSRLRLMGRAARAAFTEQHGTEPAVARRLDLYRKLLAGRDLRAGGKRPGSDGSNDDRSTGL